MRTDAGAFGLAPGPEREPRAPRPVVYGPPSVAFLDLPQLRESVPAHQPLAAVYAVPWPGRVAVWRSPGEDGFELVTTLGRPARMGRLVADLYPGPTSRFDLGNVAIVDLAFGTLASVTDLALFGGANALAVEAAPGVWEVLQFGVAELIAPGRYRLSRLLRGQRGTEGAMGTPAPAGARVVVLDEALAPLPVGEAALGLEANWRVGPASKPVSDRSYRALELHARGRRPAAVLGRPRRAAVAHGARARRSRDPLDPPLARARRRQLDRAGERLPMKAPGIMRAKRFGIGLVCGVGWRFPRGGWPGGGVLGRRSGSGGRQAPEACHVVGEGVPEDDGLDLFDAAHQQAEQAAVAGLGVDELRGRGALLVDRLGVVAAHAAAPLGDGGRVARQGRVRVTPAARGGRRGVDRHAVRREGGGTRGGLRPAARAALRA